MIASATDLLYLLCSLALVLSAGYVLLRERRNRGWSSPDNSARRWFVLLAVSLLAWVSTLYVFDRYQVLHFSAQTVLLLGRANFASIAIGVYFALRFVLSLANRNGGYTQHHKPFFNLLLIESVLMAMISFGSALIGKSEVITAYSPDGSTVFLPRPVTTYGALFALYVLHVIAYLISAIAVALTARREVPRPCRDQLGLIASGMIATGGIALVTNAALPYFLGDFRYTDVGTLSTLLFLVAVGWAVARHRLFNLRVFIRKTLVYGILLSMVAALYSAVVLFLTARLSEGRVNGLVQFAVIALAGAFDPIKRFLDDKIDHLLFAKRI